MYKSITLYDQNNLKKIHSHFEAIHCMIGKLSRNYSSSSIVGVGVLEIVIKVVDAIEYSSYKFNEYN